MCTCNIRPPILSALLVITDKKGHEEEMDHLKSLIPMFLLIFIDFLVNSNAQPSPPIGDDTLLNLIRICGGEVPVLQPGVGFAVAGVLSFIAAAISSAGGIGGGGLFVPILIIVAGLDVKTAMGYSAFMVTGGSIANVATHILQTKGRIDYDIVLLSEPSMLLGVSAGVILHVVLPEWLITAFFVGFIAFCTFKTCQSGVCYWRQESEAMTMRGESMKVPLLSEGLEECKMGIPWMKVGVLVAVWVSFFLVNILRGNTNGHGIIKIKVCGKAYWIISLLQIPLAIIFTTWIIFTITSRISTHQDLRTRRLPSGKLIFPVMALLAGLIGGIFGIGGGMLISPLLLQIGIQPQVTAATCSFMVFFSSTMSAIQYMLLGMEDICGAVALSVACFVASLIGLTLVQQAIVRYGRASLIVFSIGTVMGLSTLLMTSFGAIETWRDYSTGQSMGFHKPC